MTLLTIKTNGKQCKNCKPKERSEYTVVFRKFAVDTNLLYLVTSSFEEILPSLVEGEAYTTEDLVGLEFWATMPAFAQRQAHLCLKHMATMPGTRLIDMANEFGNKNTFRVSCGS